MGSMCSSCGRKQSPGEIAFMRRFYEAQAEGRSVFPEETNLDFYPPDIDPPEELYVYRSSQSIESAYSPQYGRQPKPEDVPEARNSPEPERSGSPVKNTAKTTIASVEGQKRSEVA
ncbi:hypothetical protein FHETE_4932 [Fusarium heterosporum]|uniref:Uncharacterized protein n=1 Tax=Fusarium heterosporum TaxID=42747 RepID=A0A8H5TG96_FUSHE|nr:hypothetical protein FHETE_4932 [Fusarium heterosporum]